MVRASNLNGCFGQLGDAGSHFFIAPVTIFGATVGQEQTSPSSHDDGTASGHPSSKNLMTDHERLILEIK